MTTKPKAKKFRIRRSSVGPEVSGVAQPSAAPQRPIPASDPGQRAVNHIAKPSKTPRVAPTPSSLPASQDTEQTTGAELEIDGIKREGLTGRQLRMARRVAQKNGLAATSDFDAVRLLRANGIDPFQRTNMLDLVTQDSGTSGASQQGRIQLPQTTALSKGSLPSTELAQDSPAERRAKEITQIQKEIAQRRRRRLALLFARLAVFVFLPTLLAGWYFYSVATPMYSTKSAFLVQQAEGGSGSGLGSLLPSQLNVNGDAIAVQDYLTSKDAMLRLDRDVGFKSHFSNPTIDPIQRLDPNPSHEKAYKLYKKYVKISYDPTEGSIRMEVIAANPEVATNFSRALISYAEERADDLSQRKREDHLRDARDSLGQAKNERREAQEALVLLQEGTVIDPEGLIASLRTQVSNVQIQLQEKELQLAALEDNLRPNKARVEGVKGDIRRLSNLLATLESKMHQAAEGESSLAQKTAQIRMAQADLATADLLMQSALQTLKQTELEASRQVRYLTTSVEPVASEDPSYPRSFENTILAFLIFSGIYLMISLTASILREQVSS
ncbi:capsular polysaccharide transport system permease protein [Shimia gijangensis]|uniref:Capsular polysaccharide transport system permease protein n=1 Tax=Shimia gijangensis TaxID=1470563 RepID=A0A1M6FTN2_9RHOB|nr:capsule biosynthesis protein [Shimia gijangensis]SHJ00959.1 capsular polysaccharide transport system permease protein [Shimia gijangensis]